MWVERIVALIKPGIMAEAVAHIKSAPPQEGVSMRVLRPVTGEQAGFTLIVELSFEDLDAHYASWADPQPAGDWTRRWIELSENRGREELYEVVHEVPSEGAPGRWLDRRVRWVKGKQRDNAIALWRRIPPVCWEGYSFRVLIPYAGERANNIVVAEWTASSVPGMLEPYYAMRATPEGTTWAASIWAMETQEPTIELYRIVA